MNYEEAILARLDAIEEQIRPLAASAKAIDELKDDLAPRIEEAVRALIIELQDVEADFQLEDLIFLVKKTMRNVRNFTFVLEQMQNLIDFATTAEPILKVTVPEWISRLDELEQKGVFNLLRVGLTVVDRIAQTTTREEMDMLGDGLVRLVGITKKLMEPEALDLLEKLAGVPARIDVSRAQPMGRWKMLWALSDPDLRKGLGVALELTKALGVVQEKPKLAAE
ncbi:MAG: DUF1641 domain-containing protein [Syntrophobacteraceae bacterium]